MESIQDDALANAILGRLKKGPLSQVDIYKDFQRHGQDRLVSTLAKLRHTKQITRDVQPTGGRPKTVWRRRDKVTDEKTKPTPGSAGSFVH